MIFRRRALSELFVHHIGCNGLGGIESALILLPIALWPDQPVGAASNILELFCSVMVVVIDVWWRTRDEEREHWPRAVNWLAGGTICYIPGWFCGTVSTAIVLFAIFVRDVPHVPKLLHPSATVTRPAETFPAEGAPGVPQECRNGTATTEQARAWAKVILNSDGAIVTTERELTPGGKPAFFLSDTANAGTGGNQYVVFDQTPKGLRYLGNIDFGACRAVPSDASGRARLVTYWHLGASEGELCLWLLTDDGFREVKKPTIHPGDGGTVEGNRTYDAFFGADPVTEPLLHATFGGDATTRPT